MRVRGRYYNRPSDCGASRVPTPRASFSQVRRCRSTMNNRDTGVSSREFPCARDCESLCIIRHACVGVLAYTCMGGK